VHSAIHLPDACGNIKVVDNSQKLMESADGLSPISGTVTRVMGMFF
jgi:hypothetical protein